MKRFTDTETKKAKAHWSATGNEERFWSREENASQTRILFLIGLHGVSLVRTSGGTFKTSVHDILEGRSNSCHLGETICRLLVLPGPAPPRCPSARRPGPRRQWYVRVLDLTIVEELHADAPNSIVG